VKQIGLETHDSVALMKILSENAVNPSEDVTAVAAFTAKFPVNSKVKLTFMSFSSSLIYLS